MRSTVALVTRASDRRALVKSQWISMDFWLKFAARVSMAARVSLAARVVCNRAICCWPLFCFGDNYSSSCDRRVGSVHMERASPVETKIASVSESCHWPIVREAVATHTHTHTRIMFCRTDKLANKLSTGNSSNCQYSILCNACMES